MKRALWLFLSAVLGALAGLGLTLAAVEWPPSFSAVAVGPWQGRPGIGSVSADPYSRAMMAYRGEVPLAAAEGIALTANEDSDGKPLDLRCSYALVGAVPAANYWTLTVYQPDGSLAAGVRQSYTSSETLLAEDGTMLVSLSPDPQPGNWIPLRGSGHFTLFLRLYETQVSSTMLALDKASTPAIQRGRCR